MKITVRAGDCEIVYEQEEQNNQYNPICNAKVYSDGSGVRDNETLLKSLSTMAGLVAALRHKKK